MITFTLCLFALLIGYFTYGRLCERIFAPDNRITPAIQHADGIDYMVLPPVSYTHLTLPTKLEV